MQPKQLAGDYNTVEERALALALVLLRRIPEAKILRGRSSKFVLVCARLVALSTQLLVVAEYFDELSSLLTHVEAAVLAVGINVLELLHFLDIAHMVTRVFNHALGAMA